MSLSSLFSKPIKGRILVVGDFMLDTYTIGSVKRVSPEAPVMVVNAKQINKLPGGAGNVALNLVSLGAKVSVLGRLGNDSAKEDLLEKLNSEKIDTSSLYIQKGYQTPIKNRIMAGSQQIVRIDFEEKEEITSSLEQKIIADLKKILKDVLTIAVSDYAKGFLTRNLLQALLKTAKELDIPVVVDPKGNDFTKYKGAYLIKPNFQEAVIASGHDEETNLEVIANTLYQTSKIPNIMVTQSSKGIALFTRQEAKEYPVKVREVVDVTGAGDTVLAVLTHSIANNISLDQAVMLCNLAAGEVIEHLGCAQITIKTLAELILNRHLDNKVFSEKYLKIIQFILDYEDFVLINLSLEEGLNPYLFGQLKKIKKENPQAKLVIYLKKDLEEEALIELLASLVEVDFIIKKSGSLQKFCEKHTPKQIYDLLDSQVHIRKSLATLSL
ncbi:MAG: Bifunctional protein HldE [Chlamydiae bacterium]|nr:Bifunctional protein HldE [Chlamydiota bacterium]